MLDDHILKAQTMHSSAYIKPFEEEMKLWEDKLISMQVTITDSSEKTFPGATFYYRKGWGVWGRGGYKVCKRLCQRFFRIKSYNFSLFLGKFFYFF